ncbi:MAG: phosphoribosylanthranilate isomerase [Lachnospiraceae bacterium]|jgi:phosphoribosylanthranilate isomerase|nr:phosphoribosylanthranilate isomerase [Lachnospiraceae bacterium]
MGDSGKKGALRIKLCGIRRIEDVGYVNEAMPDFAGFVFAPGRRQVDVPTARALRERLSPAIRAVGVFVDEDPAAIIRLLREGTIDIAQLHGGEDEAQIRRIKGATGKPVVKAVSLPGVDRDVPPGGAPGNESAAGNGLGLGSLAGDVHDIHTEESRAVRTLSVAQGDALRAIRRWQGSAADYLLFDQGKGGTGRTFDWKLLEMSGNRKPYFLAGGLNIGNIKDALAFSRQMWESGGKSTSAPFALDLSSGIETDGVKDRGKILEIVGAIRYAGD